MERSLLSPIHRRTRLGRFRQMDSPACWWNERGILCSVERRQGQKRAQEALSRKAAEVTAAPTLIHQSTREDPLRDSEGSNTRRRRAADETDTCMWC